MNKTTHISLALFVAIATALVTTVSMAVYAVFQYQTQDYTIVQLIVHHSWHVVVIGVLTYLLLFVLLHYMVVKPVHALYVKLYTISRGDRELVQVDSRITEIHEIVEGVNLLLSIIAESEGADQETDSAQSSA